MAPRTRFDPDVTVGELQLLLTFGELEPEVGANARGPMAILRESTGHSKSVIRAAFERIGDAFDVEVVAQDASGVTRITDAGHNVARIAWIAKALATLAAHKETDQETLLRLISDIQHEINRRHKAGDLDLVRSK